MDVLKEKMVYCKACHKPIGKWSFNGMCGSCSLSVLKLNEEEKASELSRTQQRSSQREEHQAAIL